MRNYLMPILLTTSAVIICVMIGNSYNHIVLGWTTSLLISAILGLVARYDSELWMLAVWWYGLLGLASMAGLTLGAMLVL